MEAAGVAVRRGDPSGARRRAMRRPSVEPRDTAGIRRTATRRAVVFCAVGSSKGSSVVPATTFALLLPTTQNPYGAGVSILENQALRLGALSGNATMPIRPNSTAALRYQAGAR